MKRNRQNQRGPTDETSRGRSLFGFKLQIPCEISRWYPLLLIVITLGLFFQNVYMEFTYDDQMQVLENPLVRDGDLWALLKPEGNILLLRQVRTLTYMVDHTLFGFSPAGYHLHNLFWHGLCVVLVFLLLRKITQQGSISFFGALIFAIHPIHVEAISNITNRKELLALGFLLIAFLCYVRFLETESAGKWVWLFMGLFSWCLGLFSKQVTIIFPFLLIAYEFLLVSKGQRFLTRNLPLLVVLLGAIMLPFIFYASSISDAIQSQDFLPQSHSATPQGYRGELTNLTLFATSARAFWKYIQLLVWPIGLCPDHVVELSNSFLDGWVLLGWSGIIAFIVTSLCVSRRWPLLAFGMIWFFFTFVPISNWIPTAYILADRYMYIPSVGYCIVVVTLFRALYRSLLTTHHHVAIGITSFLAVALIAGYTSITLAYNPHWRNQRVLFTYMLKCNPMSPQAYNGLGIIYLKEGLYAKAVQSLSRSIELGNPFSFINRGNAFYQMGKFQAAIKDYNQAIAFRPKWGRPYNNRGTVFYELGEYEVALKDYNNAISLQPNWGEGYFNRGILWLTQKKYERAVEDFSQALEKLPNQSRVLNARGLAYEKLGHWKKAEEDYHGAILSDPMNGEAFLNLGRVQIHNGELESAIVSYQKAKELGWEGAEAVLKILRKKNEIGNQ